MSSYTKDLQTKIDATLLMMDEVKSPESLKSLVTTLVKIAYLEGQAEMLDKVEKAMCGGKK